jgi:predicted NBD/HSP70 family sugar kinase
MYLLFDIGGTKLRLAVSEDGESFNDPYMVETPESFEDGMRAFKEGLNKVSFGKNITKASGGIRGVLSGEKDKLLNDSRLTDWLEKPLKQSLREIVNADVYLEHDTALGGLGEAMCGAGKGYLIVAYITVSTGVGGSKIVNGKIDEGVYGFEPGHQIIDLDGSVFPDALSFEGGNNKGHLEAYISGTALEKRFNKKPHEITDESVWDEMANYLAVGLNNIVVHWSPDAIILGGGMMKSPGISVDNVKMHLSKLLKIYPRQPEIKKAELGDFGGLYGAMEYLKQRQ